MTTAKQDDKSESKIFKLSSPLNVGDRTLTELSLDCSDLTGGDFRRISARYRKSTEGNEVHAIRDEFFRLLVVAHINKIPVEDLDLISFSDATKLTSQVLYFFIK